MQVKDYFKQNNLKITSLFVLFFTLIFSGCTKEEAKEKGKEVLEVAKEKGKVALEVAKDKGGKALEVAKEKGKEWVDQAKNSPQGEVVRAWSKETLAWLKSEASDRLAPIKPYLEKSKQVYHTTVAMGKILGKSIDQSIHLEPIYAPVNDPKAIEEAIGKMTLVQMSDGVKIGIQDMSGMDGKYHKSKTAYLVLWVQGDHLMGFVYRSERKIDLEQLAKDTPELVRLSQSVIEN